MCTLFRLFLHPEWSTRKSTTQSLNILNYCTFIPHSLMFVHVKLNMPSAPSTVWLDINITRFAPQFLVRCFPTSSFKTLVPFLPISHHPALGVDMQALPSAEVGENSLLVSVRFCLSDALRCKIITDMCRLRLKTSTLISSGEKSICVEHDYLNPANPGRLLKVLWAPGGGWMSVSNRSSWRLKGQVAGVLRSSRSQSGLNDVWMRLTESSLY